VKAIPCNFLNRRWLESPAAFTVAGWRRDRSFASRSGSMVDIARCRNGSKSPRPYQAKRSELGGLHIGFAEVISSQDQRANRGAREKRDISPTEADVGVMAFGFGELTDFPNNG
jgi:hypothetical protein